MLPDIVQSGGGSLWGATALLVTTVALSPILLLIGAYSAEARAQRLLDCVSHPVWVLSSFAVCEAILIYMERSPKLEQLGLVSERLSESDGFVASLVVAMFSAIIMVDCVLFLLWPQMLRTNRSVLCGMTINCIACSSYVLKFMQGEISMGDISGQRLSLTRYIVWNHTISLMCVLLNTLTRVTPQQACARVFLAFLTIEAGFAGSVDIGCISVSILLIAISQFALTRLCVLLFYSLRDSSSFAWQRSVVGMFVFTTWHIFPVIWLVVALSVVDASIEFPLYSIADVLSKVLITTTMLQGHVKVASDKLVDDFTHVQAERQVMEDDLHEMIASAAVPIIVTNSLGQITVWNRQVADRSRVKPEAAQGQPLWALDLLTPASADGCRHALEEILRPPSGDATTARTSVSFELRFEHHSQGVSSTSEPTTNSGSDGQHALEQNGGACAAGKGVNGRRSSSPNMTPSGKNGGGGGSGGRGNTTLLLVTASVTRNAEGRTVGLVCLCADMTAEVERLMAEASRAQIEAVNDAKDKFLACMSHEMRTPLSALIGLLQLINLKPTAEWNHAMLAPFIRSSLRSAEHLCVLVSDVLDMSKVQQGRLSLDYKELDLKEMVDAVHGRCRHVLSAIESRERQIELIVTIEPEPSASNGGSCLRVLRGDEQRIQQVMTNLGTNAIKYTLQGSVSLHVSVLPLDPSKAAELGLDQEAAHYAPRPCVPVELCVRVRDTGIGIPKNALKRIFELFETAMGDAAIPHGGQGISSASGIGLAICKELVNAMGGSLSVESSVGAGSTFTFKLATLGFYDGPITSARLPPIPRLMSRPADDDESQHGRGQFELHSGVASPADGGEAAPQQPGRLLLVEDDEMNRAVIAMFLDGHRIGEAHNGLEAIVCAFRELRSAEGVDMIIMDINMPMLTGRQASQLIRLMQYGVAPWAAHIPIVALTANAMDAEMRKSLDAGMSACLTKPVPLQALVDLVSQSLSNCRQVEYTPPHPAQCGRLGGYDENQHAHIEACIPLLRELVTLVVAALQHDVGVRAEMAERAESLLGCLGWALELLGDAHAVSAIGGLLEQAAAAQPGTLDLTAAAKELLAAHARDWLDFDALQSSNRLEDASAEVSTDPAGSMPQRQPSGGQHGHSQHDRAASWAES